MPVRPPANPATPRLIGVDGCPAGWIAVVRAGAAPPSVHLVSRFEALLALEPTVMAIDMPIGLPDRVGPEGRGPERALRALLGARQSSVFAIPSRAAVYAGSYGEACVQAAATSDPPRKVSKQGFYLFPKIREVDEALRMDRELVTRVFEVHPEGAFMALNGFAPLAEPKKLKGRPHDPGLAERRALLIAGAGFEAEFLAAPAPRGAGADDMLDACACAWVAGRILAGVARRFPDQPLTDGHGLPVAIWA
jgi:predicted RNase H-like nuclease